MPSARKVYEDILKLTQREEAIQKFIRETVRMSSELSDDELITDLAQAVWILAEALQSEKEEPAPMPEGVGEAFVRACIKENPAWENLIQEEARKTNPQIMNSVVEVSDGKKLPYDRFSEYVEKFDSVGTGAIINQPPRTRVEKMDKSQVEEMADSMRKSSVRTEEMEKSKPYGKYQQIGLEIGTLVEEKNAAYGNSFGKAAEFLTILYPDGIPPEAYTDALCIVRIFDKLMRLATNKGYNSENVYGDICGYAILGIAKDRAEHGLIDDDTKAVMERLR